MSTAVQLLLEGAREPASHLHLWGIWLDWELSLQGMETASERLGGQLPPGGSECLLRPVWPRPEFLGATESGVTGVGGKIRDSSHADAWR